MCIVSVYELEIGRMHTVCPIDMVVSAMHDNHGDTITLSL
jgi:hypothetical protein